jgi:heme-degrading monooxygenase HmoA
MAGSKRLALAIAATLMIALVLGVAYAQEEQENGGVLYSVEWKIAPGNWDAYMDWAFGDNSAFQRLLVTPGLVKYTGYDSLTGSYRLVSTLEFPDLATWADWRSHEDVGRIHSELWNFASDISTELWGPSANVPKPIKLGEPKTGETRPILQAGRWNIITEKEEAYNKWSKERIPVLLGVPGVTEFRAYRRISGESEVLVMIEFVDQAAWAAWHSNEKVQKVIDELRMYTSDLKIEICSQVATRQTGN